MPPREVTDFQRVVGRLPDFELRPDKAALLVVDMHYYQVHRDYGYGRRAKELGLEHLVDFYYTRVTNQVVPRLQEVIPRFRRAGAPVVFCRVQSARDDGSDFCLRYRAWGMRIDRNSREAQILDELAPEPGDILLDKTTQNIFVSTNLDQMLRNMGRHQLVVAGVVTNNCVEAAVRMAADLSYEVFLLEDCCAAFTPQAHENSLKNIHMNFALVMDSSELAI